MKTFHSHSTALKTMTIYDSEHDDSSLHDICSRWLSVGGSFWIHWKDRNTKKIIWKGYNGVKWYINIPLLSDDNHDTLCSRKICNNTKFPMRPSSTWLCRDNLAWEAGLELRMRGLQPGWMSNKAVLMHMYINYLIYKFQYYLLHDCMI